VKTLKSLTQQTEKVQKQLANYEKSQAEKKTKPKAKVKAQPAKKTLSRKPVAKKTVKGTAVDAVLEIIGNSQAGVTTADIKKETGFDNKKIWSIIMRAKKQGKVKSIDKGVYEKA
jgi:hypothetical protein